MAKRRRKTHLIRSCDAPLLMARILGSAGSTVTRLSISGRGGQQFVAKNVAKDQQMPQCLGPFRNPVLCCHRPITGSPQRSASTSTSSPRRNAFEAAPRSPAGPFDLRSRLRRPGPVRPSGAPWCPASSFAGSPASPPPPHVLSFVPRSVPRAADVVVSERRLSVYLRAPRNGARGAVTARVALV